MSGRLIMEYRDGHDVTRIEREVRADQYAFSKVERKHLEAELTRSSRHLLDGAIPEVK